MHLLGCEEEGEKLAVAPSGPAVPVPWHAGQGADYTFGLSSKTQVGKMPSRGSVEVTGKVRLVAESLEGGKVRIHFHPSELELKQPPNAGEGVVADLRADLGRPFAVELKAGVLESYLEPEESSLMAFGLRRQLMALAQRVEPGSAHEETWSGGEWDASGLAEVKYALAPSKKGTYSWEKTGYSKVLANRGAESALEDQSWKPQIAASEGSIEIDVTGVVAIERDEVLQTELMPEQFLRTGYKAKLRRLGKEQKAEAPSTDGLERRKKLHLFERVLKRWTVDRKFGSKYDS